MKSFKYFIFLGCILIIKLPAQNYVTVNPDRTGLYTYEQGYGNITSIRVDSVVLDSIGATYFFLNNIQCKDYCYSPYSPSWLGEKVIVREDGYNIFFNRDNDTVRIKIDAALTESWLCFDFPDASKIIAKITAINTMSFLGITDTVKTINFQAYDKNDNQIDNRVNNKEIELSKNNGFIKVPDFYLFPDLESCIWYSHGELQEYDLVGLSNPQLGIKNLTWKEAFDFEPGDEIHIYYKDSTTWYPEIPDYRIIYSIKKYLDKEYKGDSIVYKIELKNRERNSYSDNGVEIISIDTISEIITDKLLFDNLPGEPVIYDGEAFSYYMGTFNGRSSKTEPSYYAWITGGGTCWQETIVDDCWTDYTYVEGLGGPYYESECITPGIPREHFKKIVYYKKGEETWGNPLVITGERGITGQPVFDIFPNPVIERLHIRTKTENIPYSIELIDITGRVLFNENVDIEEYTINCSKAIKGICFYRIINTKGTIIKGKIIFE